MKIVIKFHEEMRGELQRWYRSLADDPAERRRIGDSYIEELKRRLIEFEGTPHEAFIEESVSPPRFWWKFTNDLWVHYCVQKMGIGFFGRLLGGAVCKVTILGFDHDPGV
jgi:hypothetical protein